MGRAVHIHFKVRTYSGSTRLDEFTSQFFFDESITDIVHAQPPYSTRGRRDTLNTTDGIFRGTQNSDRLLATVTQTSQGYAASIDFGVNLRTPAISKAVLTSSGVVNAASYQAGVAAHGLLFSARISRVPLVPSPLPTLSTTPCQPRWAVSQSRLTTRTPSFSM